MLKHDTGADPIEALRALRPETQPAPPAVPGGSAADRDAIAARWALPRMPVSSRPALLNDDGEGGEIYSRNVENFIGTVKVPVGLAGPLRVNGLYAQGDYYVPLATTEAALVASYIRGAQTHHRGRRLHGRAAERGRYPRARRSPSTPAAGRPCSSAWASASIDVFRECAEATTRYGKLIDLQVTVEGNHVYLDFEFTTGDASGQNMVTIATDAICRHIDRALADPAELLVHRGQPVRRQEGHHPVVPHRARQEGDAPKSCCPRRWSRTRSTPPPTRSSTTGACRRSAAC